MSRGGLVVQSKYSTFHWVMMHTITSYSALSFENWDLRLNTKNDKRIDCQFRYGDEIFIYIYIYIISKRICWSQPKCCINKLE